MLNVNNIITALDTPSSLLPFFVKDSFDITGRTVMANNEGGKHEAREKFIEEAGTSAFWICGIPLIRYIGNKIFKHKLDTDIDFKRINSNGVQGYFADQVEDKFEKQGQSFTKKKFTSEDLKGIVLNGEKLEKIKAELKSKNFVINGDKGFYKKYNKGLTAASVLINLAILTFALPKFNQYLSRVIISKETKKQKEQDAKAQENQTFKANNNTKNINKTPNNKVPFGKLSDLLEVGDLVNFEKMAEKAQLNVQSSMLLLDYGISGSRVTFIPRDNNERVENAIKEGGIVFFFYYAADILKTKLAALAHKVFKTPIDLDYKVLANKEFLHTLQHPDKKETLLDFADVEKDDKNAELKVIKFIDEHLAKVPKNPKDKNNVFDNFTLKTAQEDGLIKVEYDEQLQRWIRDSKKYIQTDKIVELNENLRKFYDAAFKDVKASSIEKFISKAKGIKIASVFANMAICCASVSFILPKIQYLVREHRTKTTDAPGIKHYQDLAKNDKLKV